ncbi:phosphoribosyltransferase family protein [Salinibacterium sp. ZJ77]|uniref:phosphoribosyltransferase n=1 Tax=Salinibacterium sp. ZJ77 TaxID=2708337 RepID=UPI0014223FF5|nr:phosphoribosyltransferase family protein [Salinibacterium sp. ZJ77]
MQFTNRVDAGERLARELEQFGAADAVVLGIPRGGVPVAAVVAEKLNLPLDVVVVRKLGLPFDPEVAMGAIGEGGARVLDEHLASRAGVSAEGVAGVEERERRTLDERVDRLRRGGASSDLDGRTAIVVDDGLATGATMQAACLAARARGAARVVAAVPVAAADAMRRITAADEVVAVLQPRDFWAVGAHYIDFRQTSDEEVERLLAT